MAYIFEPGYSQEYTTSIRYFGTEEGLSHREVHAIFQDKDDFMWIGARFGLNRFDGKEFKWWTTEETGYNFNNISRIGQDDEGWLWLWNDESITFLHARTEEVKSLEERFPEGVAFETKLEKLGSWKFWRFREMPVDTAGQLYFTAKNPSRILVYSGKNGFREIPLETDFDKLEIKRVAANGSIWANNGSTLLRISPKGEILDKYLHGEKEIISQLYIAEQQVFYHNENLINAKGKAFSIDERGSRNTLDSASIYSLNYNAQQKMLWVRHPAGWQILNLKGDLVHTIPKEEFDNKYFRLNFFYSDKIGNIWIGSDFGLTLVQLTPSRFNKHFSFSEKEGKPYNNSARGITRLGEDILVNFEMGGLTLLRPNGDEKLNDWELLNRAGLSLEEIQTNGIYDYWSRPILEKEVGKYWIGGKLNLTLFDAKTLELTEFPYQLDTGQIAPVDIWSLYIDAKKTIWAGTGNGLAYKDADSEQVEILKIAANQKDFSEAVVLNFITKDDQNVWLCTNRGLYLFNTKEKIIKARYHNNGAGEFYIPIDDVKYLYEDGEGIIWLGTGGGLIRWDKKTNNKRLFTRKDGLPNTNLYVIYEDDQEHLWMSSDYGIIQFNKQTFSIQTFLPKDGLSYHEFNRISHYQAKDGAIYFGSMNGLTSFYPKDFYNNENQVSPKLDITDFSFFDGDANKLLNKTGDLRTNLLINLKPEDRFFSIKFALLNFKKPAVNQYAYKIEGLDEDWVYLPDGFVRLNRLPYGKYNLLLKGQTTSGSTIESELPILLNVLKPYYLQSWFLIISFGLFLLGIYAYNQWRNKNLQQQKEFLEREIANATAKIRADKQLIVEQSEELKSLNATKDRLFGIIGHDLRKPALAFRGISKKVNFLIKRKEFDTLNRLGENLEQTAFSLNSLLDNLLNWALKQQNGLTIEPQPVNIQQATEEILQLFLQIADEKGIYLALDMTPKIHVYADQNALNTIIRNLVDNAIKFTPEGGKVEVISAQKGDKILIEIKDTGRGMTPNQLEHIFELKTNKSTRGTAGESGSGLGLPLVKDLVDLNKGVIIINSQYGKGTSFKLLLPAA